MANLVTVKIGAELLDTSISSLQVTACHYKKQHGKYPSWYKSDGKAGGSKAYIDMGLVTEARELERNVWLHCTDYLYWWLTDWMKINKHRLSFEMAKRSKIYTNQPSWESFLSSGLFNLPKDNVISSHRTMAQEFAIYGTAMVLAYYRDNYL